MQIYNYRIATTAGHPSWEYSLTYRSDEAAIERASRWVEQMANIPWIMGLDIYRGDAFVTRLAPKVTVLRSPPALEG